MKQPSFLSLLFFQPINQVKHVKIYDKNCFNQHTCFILETEIFISHVVKSVLELQVRNLFLIWHKPFFLRDCRSPKKLLRPSNAIIPFPLSESKLSGPFCYPVSSQIASSPVNAFILSPPCLGSDTLPSSDSIKNHNFSSWDSDQTGRLMHFYCVLIFFFLCTSYLHIDWVFISLRFKADSL